MHQLPAGLLNESIEFFVDTENLKAYALQSGAVIGFENFPAELKTVIQKKMDQHPEKHKALWMMAGDSDEAMMKQYLYCNYGGFDNQPDFQNGRLQAEEYWACPKRGTCKYEGIVCCSLTTASGETLSTREVEVLKLVALGWLEQQVADFLFISLHTVATHTRNIRAKTGLASKADLTRFAIQKNLI